MKKQTNLISQNLTALRQCYKYSQEEVAEKVGIALVPGDTVLRNIAFLRDMLNDDKGENL